MTRWIFVLVRHLCDALPQLTGGALPSNCLPRPGRVRRGWKPPATFAAITPPYSARCFHFSLFYFSSGAKTIVCCWEDLALTHHHHLTTDRASHPFYPHRRAQDVRKTFFVSRKTRQGQVPSYRSRYPSYRYREELGVSTSA